MSYQIRRAAVIGSGTMGGGIAAHLANVGIPVDLLDIAPNALTPEEEAAGLSLEHPKVRNRIVQQGWDRVVGSSPAALMSRERASLVRLGNTADHLDRLKEADYIIEVVIERLDIKRALMAQIDELRKPEAIVATNTSGIPIKDIAAECSLGMRQHFVGMHFFNPPRYLKLLELIPHPDTKLDVIAAMSDFATRELGKGVVLCKDTPNFIGNRIFSIAGAYELSYAIENGYTVDEVDSLMGPLVGRPKTAVFRLLDLVGLDVMAHVSQNLYDLIPQDESREMLRHERSAAMTQTMLDQKWLGNKTGTGFYKRVSKPNGEKEFWSLNLQTMEHTAPQKPRFDSVGRFRKLEPTGARIKAMVEAEDRAGQYIRAVLYNLMAYASRRVPEIADEFPAVDKAIKWGFAHEMGPFEVWDAVGVAEHLPKMEAAGYPVAEWVKELVAAGFSSFYQYEGGIATGFYDLASKAYKPFPPDPRRIEVATLIASGKVLAENEDARVIDMGDGIGLFEWHSKAQTLTPAMMEMAYKAIAMVGEQFAGLVVGHQGELFCGGANLDMMALQQEATKRGVTPAQIVDELSHNMQQMMLGFRYAPGPVVMAPFDRALGGGAELTMAGDRAVAHAEFYVGLVEAGLGLLPAASGMKELLRRIVNPVMRLPNADPLPPMMKVLELIGTAKVALSAQEARDMGFLRPEDRIIANREHLLAEAKREALHMAEAGYRPPQPEKIYAAGRDLLAAIQTNLHMMHDGGYITPHDVTVTNKIAWVLCGGDLSDPTWVDEQYILDLERQMFVELIQEPKTVERILHMLQTGKPLRN